MGDYYLSNPGSLKGQPKRTIGDYVASQGILVPRRFDSLTEARKSGLSILARSEHEQEYNGVSGLLVSVSLEGDNLTDEGVKKLVFQDETRQFLLGNYSFFTGVPKEELEKEISFSLWEKLGGINRMIIADSAIPGRYHITGHAGNDEEILEASYMIYDQGEKRIVHKVDSRAKDDVEGLDELVRFYEEVRTLPNFDSNHCPILEVQSVDGKNYFLQYHRTRNQDHANFTIDPEEYPDHFQAEMVRGATKPDGEICLVTLRHKGEMSDSYKWESVQEDGALDNHFNIVYSELKVRDRKLQIIDTQALDWLLGNIAIGHKPRSKLFKPKVSVVVPRDYPSILRPEEDEQWARNSSKSPQHLQARFHVVSDGKRAYIKRISK